MVSIRMMTIVIAMLMEMMMMRRRIMVRMMVVTKITDKASATGVAAQNPEVGWAVLDS